MADVNGPSQWDRLAQTQTIVSSARKRAKKKIFMCPAAPLNPPKTTTTSFFDRLSKTETFATATSKGKTTPVIQTRLKKREIGAYTVAEKKSSYHSIEKTTNAFFDRISKAETYATATMKGKISLTHKGNISPPHETSTDKKLTTNAFFERMSKAETYATSDMKGKISPTHEIRESPDELTTNAFFERMSKAETYATSSMKGKISPTYETPADNKMTTNAFFDRMSKAETYATSSMKGKISSDYERKDSFRL